MERHLLGVTLQRAVDQDLARAIDRVERPQVRTEISILRTILGSSNIGRFAKQGTKKYF